MPRDRILHDLPIYASVAAKLVLASPFFQVEEVAEELEGVFLRELLESDGTPEVSL